MNERENNARENKTGAPARNGANGGGLRARTSRRRPKFCYYCVEKQEQVEQIGKGRGIPGILHGDVDHFCSF